MPNGFTEQDRKTFERLQQDMWFGNGLPGVTTRLKEGETRLDKLEEYNTTRENRLERKINLTLSAVLVGLVSLFIAVMAKH